MDTASSLILNNHVMASVNPLQQVFDKAKREFKSELPARVSFDSLLAAATIDDVYDVAEKYQKEQQKTSKLRHLQRIQPLLDRLKEYAGVIEVFVQVKPDVLALLWGPIKLLLLWTSVWNQGFDAVVKTMERIGELLPSFSDVVRHFIDVDRIRDILGLFYRDILDFYVVMVQFFSLPRRKILFETLWPRQRNKIDMIESHIEKHCRLLGDNITHEHIRREHEAREQAFERFREEEASRASQRFQALEAAICPPTYGARLNGLHSKVCEGTARWLERDPAFRSWIDMSSPSTKLLWLRGIPGAGKTFLAAWLTFKAKEEGRTIYAFPSHRDRDADAAAISLMHSLLFQLASRSADIQAMLTDSDRSDLKTDTKVAKELLADVLKCAGDTFVVIDGLDEVDEFQRGQFLASLMEILDASADPKVKICISSRAEDDIARILEPRAATICIDKENTSGLFAYIDKRYQEWMAKSDFLEEGAMEIKALLQPVCTKAKGMFLYARIVVDNVTNLISIEEIRRELRALPNNLDDAYERILLRIKSLPPPTRDSVKRILGWIGCSPVPMTQYELEQAILVGSTALSDAPVVDSPFNIVRLCGPIVEIVDDEAQYVHFTVKEYLFNNRLGFVSIPDSTMELLVVCLTYLRYDAVNGSDIEDAEVTANILAGRYRLQAFASTTWFDLVKQSLRLARDANHLDVLSGLLHNFFAELENPKAIRAQQDLTTSQPRRGPLWPDAPEFVSQTLRFSQNDAKDVWTSDNAESWANLDPLTVSHSCARIETAYHALLHHDCPSAQQQQDATTTTSSQQQDCACPRLRRHYGARLYKCHYFACGFRRYGFADKADCARHMANHCRPWKCAVRSCDFATIGFQTTAQLERHRRRIHRVAVPREAGAVEPAAMEDEALYPLLYELVDTGDVGELEAVWPSCRHKINESTTAELVLMAAGQGSLPVVQLLLDWDHGAEEPVNGRVRLDLVVGDALQSGNTELARWILEKATAWSQRARDSRRYRDIVVAVLKTDSPDVFEVWHDVITSQILSAATLASEMLEKTVLNTAKRFPEQQTRMFATWRRLVELQSIHETDLGRALTNVAQTTCCVEQARILLDLGAPIDFPRSHGKQGHTALQWASKKTTQEAAEFIKFLILEGARTDVWYGNSRPSEGAGARNIHVWLGITWDELVKMGRPEMLRRRELRGG